MPKGKVKWFNPTKGYGFITPEEGDKDVFVHITAVRDSGMENLDEDQNFLESNHRLKFPPWYMKVFSHLKKNIQMN